MAQPFLTSLGAKPLARRGCSTSSRRRLGLRARGTAELSLGEVTFLEDLLPEQLKERTHRRRAHEACGHVAAPDLDAVAGAQILLLLAVDGDARGLVEDVERYPLVGREHDRVAEREMRRERDDEHVRCRREHERATD